MRDPRTRINADPAGVGLPRNQELTCIGGVDLLTCVRHRGVIPLPFILQIQVEPFEQPEWSQEVVVEIGCDRLVNAPDLGEKCLAETGTRDKLLEQVECSNASENKSYGKMYETSEKEVFSLRIQSSDLVEGAGNALIDTGSQVSLVKYDKIMTKDRIRQVTDQKFQ
ncbi:hypothetical protein C0J52_23777 [Blattella germanica]|nr:hypothetical protein C0J52_23777 [Blattella germanica]